MKGDLWIYLQEQPRSCCTLSIIPGTCFSPKFLYCKSFILLFVSLTKICLGRGSNKLQMTGKGHEEGMGRNKVQGELNGSPPYL